MDNYIVVVANGQWYDLFYNIAFLLTLAILFYEGYLRKYPMLKWILLIVMIRLLFITGTKIVTFTDADWNLLFTQGQLPDVQNKSLLGGFLFGGIGLLVGYRLFRFRQNIVDAFALVLPLGITVQRIGCFLYGCCFGKVSYLHWAVKYPVQTLPHFHQFNDNLLTYNDFLSLPVHPVQLYEMAGLIAVFFIVLKFRKSFKRSGSLFLFSLIMVFAVRFASEFFRDINAHTIGGRMVWIFNTTQLFILPLALTLLFLLWKREKRAVPKATFLPENDFGLTKAFFLLLLFITGFRLLKSWFVFSEVLAITVIFFAAFILLGYRIVNRFYFSQYRWLYLAGFILPLFLMAQTFPERQDSVLIKKYKTIKFGVASGNFENSYDIGQGSGCDRVSNTEYFQQKYTLAGTAFEFVEEDPNLNTQLHYGAKAIFGNHREIRISDKFEKNETLFGVTPYINWDSNWLGIGAGMHLGNFTYIYENLQVDGKGYPNSGSKNTFIYPQVYFRFGPQKWFFTDFHLADNFPSALPGFRRQLGIGSGLGQTNGTNLRFGSDLGDIKYLSGSFVIDNKIVLEPMFLWGMSPRYETNKNYYQFSMGISYRFGFSESKRSIFATSIQ